MAPRDARDRRINIHSAAELSDLAEDAGDGIYKWHSLHIILDADTLTDYDDDRYAIILQRFLPCDFNGHPNPPHSIRELHITFEEPSIFTRKTYIMTTPAAAKDIDGLPVYKDLHALLLDEDDELPSARYSINIMSCEKAVLKTLFKMRGVPKVVITGAIETGLRDDLIAAITTPSPSIHPPPPISTSSSSTVTLEPREFQPRVPLSPIGCSSPSQVEDNLQGDDGVQLGARLLLRIAETRQDEEDFGGSYLSREDGGTALRSIPAEWIVPTGKGARVVLGWRYDD